MMISPIFGSPIILFWFGLAIWLAWQIVKEFRIKVAYSGKNPISKEKHPIGFWVLLVAQILLVVVFFLMGVHYLKLLIINMHWGY